MAEAGTPKPVFGYIGGTVNCGSTLASFLLNAQPDVTSIGEVNWSVRNPKQGEYPCSCGATLDTCDFWLEVSRVMNQKGYHYDARHRNTEFEISANKVVRKLTVGSLRSGFADRARDKLVRRVPFWGSHLSEIGRLNSALVDSIATITNAAAFVDASKDPIRVRLLREYCAIAPYVIHLVRDAPGFVNSVTSKGTSLSTAIWRWNSMARQMEDLRTTTPPDRWLRVRYEDLCASPAAEIKRILQFLRVSGGEPVLEFRHTAHHIIGNGMRRRDSSEIRLDTRWRDQLSKAQLEHILSSTTKYRRLYGYLGRERDS